MREESERKRGGNSSSVGSTTFGMRETFEGNFGESEDMIVGECVCVDELKNERKVCVMI